MPGRARLSTSRNARSHITDKTDTAMKMTTLMRIARTSFEMCQNMEYLEVLVLIRCFAVQICFASHSVIRSQKVWRKSHLEPPQKSSLQSIRFLYEMLMYAWDQFDELG